MNQLSMATVKRTNEAATMATTHRFVRGEWESAHQSDVGTTNAIEPIAAATANGRTTGPPR